MEFVLFALASFAIVYGLGALARRRLEAHRRRARARRLRRLGRSRVRAAEAGTERAIARARRTSGRASRRELRRLTTAFHALRPIESGHEVFDVGSLRSGTTSEGHRTSVLRDWILWSTGSAVALFVVAGWMAFWDVDATKSGIVDASVGTILFVAGYAAIVAVGAIAVAAIRELVSFVLVPRTLRLAKRDEASAQVEAEIAETQATQLDIVRALAEDQHRVVSSLRRTVAADARWLRWTLFRRRRDYGRFSAGEKRRARAAFESGALLGRLVSSSPVASIDDGVVPNYRLLDSVATATALTDGTPHG
jgi:hypothetical protein